MTSRALLLVVTAALLALICLPAVADGTTSTYGELERFGEGALGPQLNPGQISDAELRFPGVFTEVLRAHLLGVEPVNNDVYVLDEPENFERKKKKLLLSECEPVEEEEVPEECEVGFGPITRHFRIQEFAPEAATGHYHAVAAATFKEKEVNPGPGEESGLAVEGIAVDPHLKRLYVLAVDVREESVTIDRGGKEANLPVASTLYAFSTEANKNGELEPLGKELGTGKHKKHEAILTGPHEGAGELAAQSNTPGRALLEPAGITVDPATDEIIILAHEDHKGEVNDSIKNPEDHYVLQRILPNGEVVSGPNGRYIDKTTFFKEDQFPQFPNSPVVVGGEHGEQVDLEYAGGIVRIPGNFESMSPPEFVYRPPTASGAAEGAISEELERSSAIDAPTGGGLSASPNEGPEGSTLYATTQVANEQPAVGGQWFSVTAFSGASGSLLGWAGAQSIAAQKIGEEADACVIQPTASEFFNPVAAGSGGKVFVLATQFLEKEMDLARGIPEEYKGTYDGVLEFGPGGTGCVPATPGGLTPEVNGQAVSSVKVGEPVTFSSFVLQGDAQEVEWNFGDGRSETVTSDLSCTGVAPKEFKTRVRQCPGTSHTYAEPGTHEVTETIHVDNLDSPVVTQTTTVTVSGSQAPTAILTGPLEVARPAEALFDGSASFDPAGPNQITEYHWVFGDGHAETTTSPTATHKYENLGSYTVSLAVTDARGQTSTPATLPEPVAVIEPPPAKGSTAATTAQQSAASSPQPAAAVAGTSTSHPSTSSTPEVSVASASLSASAKGLLPLTLYCAAAGPSCTGTVTLRTLQARVGRHGKNAKPTATMLATATFTLASGGRKRVELRLSAKARALLIQAHSHALEGELTIVARSAVGATRTTNVPVLVRAASVASSRKR